jgi:hypothetical protein
MKITNEKTPKQTLKKKRINQNPTETMAISWTNRCNYISIFFGRK